MSHRSNNNAKRQAAKMSKNETSVRNATNENKFFNNNEKDRKQAMLDLYKAFKKK